MKRKFIIYMILILLTSALTYAIMTNLYATENTYIVAISNDPTGYGITLEMLQNKYSEFSHVQQYEGEWLFHFNRNPEGLEQMLDLNSIFESIQRQRYYVAQDNIFVCAPEYISQIDKYVITCETLGNA